MGKMSGDEAAEKLTSLELFHLFSAANADLTFEESGAEDNEASRVFWDDLMEIKKDMPDVEFDLPELDDTDKMCDTLLDEENFAE
jgi:hypothetical protein